MTRKFATAALAAVILSTAAAQADPIEDKELSINGGEVVLPLRAPAPEFLKDTFPEVISGHAEGALEAHDLRTRHAGQPVKPVAASFTDAQGRTRRRSGQSRMRMGIIGIGSAAASSLATATLAPTSAIAPASWA